MAESHSSHSHASHAAPAKAAAAPAKAGDKDEPKQPETSPPPARPVEENPKKRKAQKEGTERLDESIPGGLFVRGGYYCNCEGLFVTKDGTPTDKPVLAEGFEEIEED